MIPLARVQEPLFYSPEKLRRGAQCCVALAPVSVPSSPFSHRPSLFPRCKKPGKGGVSRTQRSHNAERDPPVSLRAVYAPNLSPLHESRPRQPRRRDARSALCAPPTESRNESTLSAVPLLSTLLPTLFSPPSFFSLLALRAGGQPKRATGRWARGLGARRKNLPFF